MNDRLRTQCSRIATKLAQAKEYDRACSVFGSSTHSYRIGPTVSKKQIWTFEADHGIKLPEHYTAFLELVGNGAPNGKGKPAAGPFYGIYPLGFGLDDLVERGDSHLGAEPFVRPDMTQLEWEEAANRLDDDLSDDAYYKGIQRTFGGLLPIGHQGCQSYHALVLRGQNAGKVVNIDTDLSRPVFCYEANFLDWYERWLDEIKSGLLFKDGPSWFGYTMGGDDKCLLEVFRQSQDQAVKLAALEGFGKLISISNESAVEMVKIANDEDSELSHRAAAILTEFDYARARPLLEELLKGSAEDRLFALKAIYLHAKEHAKEWLDVAGSIAAETNDIELFQFASYILASSGIDCTQYLLPATSNQDERIRRQAIYAIGKAPKNADAIDVILKALSDEAPSVIHAALQAHEQPFDTRYHEAYALIADRFKVDEHYVLANLNRRLHSMGYKSIESFLKDYEAGQVGKRGFWSQILNYVGRSNEREPS